MSYNYDTYHRLQFDNHDMPYDQTEWQHHTAVYNAGVECCNQFLDWQQPYQFGMPLPEEPLGYPQMVEGLRPPPQPDPDQQPYQLPHNHRTYKSHHQPTTYQWPSRPRPNSCWDFPGQHIQQGNSAYDNQIPTGWPPPTRRPTCWDLPNWETPGECVFHEYLSYDQPPLCCWEPSVQRALHDSPPYNESHSPPSHTAPYAITAHVIPPTCWDVTDRRVASLRPSMLTLEDVQSLDPTEAKLECLLAFIAKFEKRLDAMDRRLDNLRPIGPAAPLIVAAPPPPQRSLHITFVGSYHASSSLQLCSNLSSSALSPGIHRVDTARRRHHCLLLRLTHLTLMTPDTLQFSISQA